MVFVLRIGFV